MKVLEAAFVSYSAHAFRLSDAHQLFILVDIAGVPGTGKTATVRSVMSSLQERATENQIKPFRFLEINGMKITDPAQSFSILWEFVSGNRVAPKAALAQLETHFKTPNPGRDTW
jgi:origin recognition complex subunit 1